MSADPFFTAPFPPADVERLLVAVDERLRRRGMLRAEKAPADCDDGRTDALPPPPHLDYAHLTAGADPGLRAPFFAADVGSGPTRLGKRTANLVLALFGRPQSYFNEWVRGIVTAWARFLEDTIGFQVVLREELTIQRAEIGRLLAREKELTARLERVEKLAAAGARPDRGTAGGKEPEPA